MRVLIKRFYNNKTWFEEFEVEYKKDETLLELLDRIKNKKRDITYRSFCRSAICGTCALVANDRTCLACRTKVDDVIRNNEIVFEPLARMKVLRDLMVDNTYLEESIKDNKLWFVGKEINSDSEYIQTPQEHKKYEKQTDCILCMACYAECEALDNDVEFAGPFVFSKYFRFVFDSRDALGKERIEEAKIHGLYNCINCQKCVMVCPKGIGSAFDIKTLQMNDSNPPFEGGGYEEINFF
jgi:succinate dehydrogenase/fumarate reductase iron-sulfur protein